VFRRIDRSLHRWHKDRRLPADGRRQASPMQGRTAVLQELAWHADASASVWPFGPAGWSYLAPQHFHAGIEVLLVLAGAARFRLGGSVVNLAPGMLVWVLPAVAHGLVCASPDFDMYSAEFSAATVRAVIDTRALGPFDPGLRHLEPFLAANNPVQIGAGRSERLAAACERAWLAHLSAASDAGVRAEVVLVEAVRAVETSADRACASLAQLAARRLASAPEMSRRGLACELRVSESYLSRAFQWEFAASFAQHRARMRVAGWLALARAEKNLLVCSQEAGFGSYSQAHRAFFRVVGEGPREYIKSGRARRVGWRVPASEIRTGACPITLPAQP
jgi:AraC-like DNA-binding protein/uncharacterized protein YjlB